MKLLENVLLLCFLAVVVHAQGQLYNITTFAGGGDVIGDGLEPASALLAYPFGVTISPSGEVYIADSNNGRIRKITTYGNISTISSVSPIFNNPSAVAISSTGEIYFSDSVSPVIRKITTLGVVSIIAGSESSSGFSGDDGLATSAEISSSFGVAISLSGEVYIADTNNNVIRKITTSGIISTVAGIGGSANYDGDGGLATSAYLNHPRGVFISSTGEIYIADSGNSVIRKVSTAGIISTIVGTGAIGYSGDGGLATSAELNYPYGVAISSTDEIYIADTYNHVIRKVTTSGIISTFAGNSYATYGGDGGLATAASLAYPSGVSISSTDEVYIADTYNNRIRKVSTSGNISTIAGTSTFGNNIPADKARILPVNSPSVSDRFLVFADSTGQVRQIDLGTQIISTIAGVIGSKTVVQTFNDPKYAKFYNNVLYVLHSKYFLDMVTSYATRVAGTGNTFGYKGDGDIATRALLSYPNGIAISSTGEIYIADTSNSVIRKVSTAGIISTIAGTGVLGYSGDSGLAISAKLGLPYGIAISSTGDIYFTDIANHRIRKINATTGIISTIAGNGNNGLSGDGGLATNAKLNVPCGISIRSNGEIYFADKSNHRIRKINATTGIISTIAGSTYGFAGDGGLATSAKLYFPLGVAISSSGEIYIADSENYRIRKVTTGGIISTISGTGTYGFSGDGGSPTSANLAKPSGVAISSTGEVYITDYGNHRVRKISSGKISTFAGTGNTEFTGDLLAVNTNLNNPTGVVITSSGELYIADYGNNRIRKVTTSGIMVTVAGSLGDGIPATTAYISATGFDFSANGEIYIADTNNHRIRKITTNGNITTIAGTGHASYDGDGGLAINAYLNGPTAVVVSSSSGEIYIVDRGNHRIRKISIFGNISTVAGTGIGGYNGDGGLATSARLNNPNGVAITSRGEVYIADSGNNRIRKISISGIISTIAGDGSYGFTGDGGLATSARLNSPNGIAIGSSGEIYITDNGSRIRLLTPYCSTNYFGANCGDFYCYGVLNNQSNVCSSNGICVFPNNCSCAGGYYGETCQYFYCNSIPFNSSTVCSSVGTCVGMNNCSCNAGYSGSYCQDPVCNGISSKNINVCSSHGNCTSPNNCSCLAGYFGNSCEEFSCFSVSYNNVSVCSGKGKCYSLNNCTCETGYYGSNCEMFNCNSISKSNSSVCSSHGICSSFNNCTCQQDYYGNDCENFNCFGVSKLNSSVCSSHGSCSSPNNCSCVGGYFANNCEDFTCFDVYYNNASTCSGQGKCSSPNNCTCTNGYYGSSCDLFDCNGFSKNNVCSAHGTCSSFNNCTCQQDYYGNDCENFNCNGVSKLNSTVCSSHGLCSSPNNCSCVGGYFGSICNQFKCYEVHYMNITVCSGQGKCSSPNNCTCETGYYGSNCEMYNCNGVSKSNSSVCSSHGSCSSFNNCTCQQDYYGNDCENFYCFGVSKQSTNVCSSHGSCLAPNACSCLEGYFGNNCADFNCFDVYYNNASTCSGQGKCSSPNNCTCETGYYGSNCEIFDCHGIPKSNSSVCSSHGSCSSFDNCTCQQNYSGSYCENFNCNGVQYMNSTVCSGKGKCSSPNNCECNIGYYGSNCELFNCNGTSKLSLGVCSGKGQCSSPDNCVCDIEYYGTNCENFDCYGIFKFNTSVCSSHGICSSFNNCTCQQDYYGNNCENFNCNGVSKLNSSVCSSHGSCSSPNKCSCVGGYFGNNCEDFNCFDVYYNNASTCSGQGKCSSPNNCKCENGYGGSQCELIECFGIYTNQTNLICNNGNGTCISPDTCKCNDGWTGTKCDVPICNGKLSNDTTVCSSRGQCVSPNTCKCDTNYYGSNCEKTTCYSIASDNINVCFGHGSCLSYNYCNCSTGYGPSTTCELPICFGLLANDSRACNDTDKFCYAPNDCKPKNPSCFGFEKLDSRSCSGHGICLTADDCRCDSSYFGYQCQYFKCNGVEFNSTTVCSSHGTCDSVNNCNCRNGYGGSNCELLKCSGILENATTVCNGRGKCIDINQCKCDSDEYFGSDCQFTTCFGVGKSSPQVCNYGNGTCLSFDNCTCTDESKWFGKQCNITYCYGKTSIDSNVCNAQGNCVNFNTCQCTKNYIGSQCELKYLSQSMTLSFNNTNDYVGEITSILAINIQDSTFILHYVNKSIDIKLEFLLDNQALSSSTVQTEISPSMIFSLPSSLSKGSLTAKATLIYASTAVSLTFETQSALLIQQRNAPSASRSLPRVAEPSAKGNNNAGIIAAAVIVPVVAIAGTGGVVTIIVNVVVMLKKKAAANLVRDITTATHTDVELVGM